MDQTSWIIEFVLSFFLALMAFFNLSGERCSLQSLEELCRLHDLWGCAEAHRMNRQQYRIPLVLSQSESANLGLEFGTEARFRNSWSWMCAEVLFRLIGNPSRAYRTAALSVILSAIARYTCH